MGCHFKGFGQIGDVCITYGLLILKGLVVVENS